MGMQAAPDARGMAQPTSPYQNNPWIRPEMRNMQRQITPQQAAPMPQQAPQQAGPAPFTAGWINPMLSQSNNAYGPQNAMQSGGAPQQAQTGGAPSMGGQMFGGNKAYPEGYQFESVPSTLDPGSMAGLMGWMGGSNSPYGPGIQQQQQGYLNSYRQQYPNGVPGVNNYITPTTNYMTGTR